MHISVSEIFPYYIVGYHVVQSCTCKGYLKTYNSLLVLLHITIQALTPVVNL